MRREPGAERRQPLRASERHIRRSGHRRVQRERPLSGACRADRRPQAPRCVRRDGDRRLAGRAGGRRRDARARKRLDTPDRRNRKRQRLAGLDAVRDGQVRAARHGAMSCAGAGSEEHPCRAFRDRRRHRERNHAGQWRRCARRPTRPRCDRAGIPARSSSAPQRLDLGNRTEAVGGAVLAPRRIVKYTHDDAPGPGNNCRCEPAGPSARADRAKASLIFADKKNQTFT
ncbi:hypothetical protein BURKHO8Y_60180 [Burkholderia sp. 8Y]|nr:hypothetical protein BURKHO8Y_60180 [Burkholderia sp. 8Y]